MQERSRMAWPRSHPDHHQQKHPNCSPATRSWPSVQGARTVRVGARLAGFPWPGLRPAGSRDARRRRSSRACSVWCACSISSLGVLIGRPPQGRGRDRSSAGRPGWKPALGFWRPCARWAAALDPVGAGAIVMRLVDHQSKVRSCDDERLWSRKP